MAKFGAKHINFAPIKTEPEGSLPTYDASVNLGALQTVTDAVNFVTGEQHGDDVLQEHVSEFSNITVDVEVAELANVTASAVLGAEHKAGASNKPGEVVHNIEDVAPWGGLTALGGKIIGGVHKYYGVFYPKVKAAMQGETFATKSNSITLSGGKLHFNGTAAKNGDFKIVSDDFATEAEAKAWCDAKLGATA